MLSYDLAGIQTVFQALQGSRPWTYDPEILELPWREEKYNSISARRCDPSGAEPNGRLVFGLLESDGHVTPHPPVRLALERVKQALLRCGYEVSYTRHCRQQILTTSQVVLWQPPPQNEAVETLVSLP